MTSSLPLPLRIPLLLGAMLALALGAEAGLVRLGLMTAPHAVNLAIFHGPLMVCAFLGTVIALERAVALRRRWAFGGPLFAALTGLGLIFGLDWRIAAALAVLASLILLLASLRIFLRQRALFTFLLLLAVGCWLAGNLLWLQGFAMPRVVPWWLCFLIITIAAERLELTRMLPPGRHSQQLLSAITALLIAGCGYATFSSSGSVTVLAAALVALALWLLRNDIARKTVHQRGLPRFIALCLLSGYCWMLSGGLVGLGAPQLLPGASYDAFLHLILVGFVFSMIFGHAPVIFPAVARIRIPYRRGYYLPLAVLHLSLLIRVAGDLLDVPHCRQIGGAGNVLAIALFILMIVTVVLRGRRQQPASPFLQPGNH